MLGDGLRLSVGTLTAIPVPPPRAVDRPVARTAMLIAPVAVVPLALGAGLLAWFAGLVSLPPLLTGALVIGLLAWGSRGMHLDGLSDTADGLGASFDRARALQIMSRGDAGPMGVATLVIVLVAQLAAVASVVAAPVVAAPVVAEPVSPWRTAAAVVLLVCASRGALALACHRAVPSAKPEGLGALVAGSVGTAGALLTALALLALAVSSAALAGRSWWLGLIAGAAAVVVVGGWLRHCTRRLGGITGDVLGSCVEIALLALVVVLAIPA